jgi:hypothetical protein
MDDHVCFLITLLYEDQLLRCALKVKQDKISHSLYEYPMEPENRKVLHDLLPEHIKSCGPIVDVEFLFEVSIIGD